MIEAGKLPRDVPPDFGYVTDAAQKKGAGNGSRACAERKAHHDTAAARDTQGAAAIVIDQSAR